ncbi:DUF1232 domain-containing protein [Lusitaniella coriacea LEGE 07157]|uniref:DUF1232 domain-containing protein n=1 Tax=Lusitaniella coriacea LEGE 07157 TaxID=945747 RepID=A0A8J7DNU9_9CYAN|nr:YkvA family protein [Lusitaniella coriacea]MBE9115209.1 DUF1232 domain-containing protein [Lusitaniella coriacea LEGE 07157]
MNISLKSLYEWYGNALRHPQYRWLIILGTLVYLISPIDISPDFIPIAGQIDDFIILSLLMSEVTRIVLSFAQNRKAMVDPPEGEAETVDVDAVSVD